MRSRVVLTLLLALAAGPAGAQAPMPSLTFDEAVSRALERNQTLARAAKSILQALHGILS